MTLTIDDQEVESPPPDAEAARPVTVAMAMQGGGVGKSTLTLAFAAALSRMGKRVIVIDNDPQHTLTIHFGLKLEQAPDIQRITDVLANPQGGIAEAAVETDWGFGFIASQSSLSKWDKGWDLDDMDLLRDAIVAQPSGADFVLIDCPPALGFNAMNALVASSHVLMIGTPRFKGWECVPEFLNTVKKVRARLNPDLEFLGAIVNQFDATEKECADYLVKYEETFGEKLWKPIVPDTVAAASMFSRHQTVYDMKSRSGAPRLRLVIDELAAKLIKETS